MRVARGVPAVAVVLSGAVSVAVGVLWHRSWHGGDLIDLDARPVGLSWWSSAGGARLSVATARPPARMDATGAVSWQPAPGLSYPLITDQDSVFALPLLGVSVDTGRNGFDGRWYGLTVPYWSVLVVAVSPGAVAARRLLPRSVPAGLCRRCGYDLRASPERCPECGAEAVASTAGIP